MVSDNCFRFVTVEVSSTGTPCAPSGARSPRSSGGRSAASVSQVRADAVDGKTRPDRCGTATSCHSSPLAACTVSTWTRLAARRRRPDVSGRQSVLDGLGRLQVRQQAVHAAEGAAVSRSRRRRRRTRRVVRCRRTECAHLHVDAQHPAHFGDKVGDRMIEVPPQCGQLLGERADAAIPGRRIRFGATRDRRWRRPGRRCRRRARPARRCSVGTRRARPPARRRARRARRHSAVRSRAPSRQRGPVSTRTAARARRGIGHQPQHRHHVGDLVDGEQTRQADHLDRQTRAPAAPRPSARRRRCGAPAPRRSAPSHRRRRARDSATTTDRPPNCVRRQRRTAARTGPCRARHPGAAAATPPPPTAVAHRPTPHWPRAGCSAGYANWCAVRASGAGLPSASGKSVQNRGRLVADAPRQP